jgi:hypothetical protein
MNARTFLGAFTLGFWLLVMTATPAAAGVTVNENAAWPSSPAIETFERTDANIESERDMRFDRDLTQTFQATSAFQVDKVYIDYEEGLEGKEISIRLFTVADVNAADPVIDPDDPSFSGTVLFSGLTHVTTSGILMGSPPAGNNNVGAAMEFDLTGADEVMLSANTGTEGYAFQIQRTGLGSDVDDTAERAFKWHYNNNDDLYASGRGYAIGGGPDAPDDFLMAIVAVPEPGALALVAMAAGGALKRRRRRGA